MSVHVRVPSPNASRRIVSPTVVAFVTEPYSGQAGPVSISTCMCIYTYMYVGILGI